MVGGLHHRYTQCATRAKVSVPHDVGRELRALRGAKAGAALDSRLSNRRQRTRGSEFRPLGHLRDHGGSRLATDKVLRNDKYLEIKYMCIGGISP